MGKQNKSIQCPKCYTLNPEESIYCNKCGSSLEENLETLTYGSDQELLQGDTVHFLPGDNFGERYKIIEEIGRGGMGRVYKAEDKELGITIALKVICPKYSSDHRFIQRFKKETILARSISQKNVIRIHDIGEFEGIKYISMDYIKGQNLKELIHTSGTLTVETALKITRQICEALKAAHQSGIVHRDLKPQNIMIDKNGRAYTMDFGLAKAIKTQETAVSGAVFGTPQYMSPEQAKGEKVDPRSDIYSLGIIMYEMLTGKQPFEAESLLGYIQKHVLVTPPLPSKINPIIPLFLEKIILKCLKKEREKRYQNIDELIKDLDEQNEIFRPLPSRDRIKKRAAVISAAFLILLVALMILLWKSRQTPVPPLPSESGRASVAVMYFENNTGNSSLNYLRRALQDYFITDLAQSKYLRILPDDRLFQILKKMKQLETRQYSSEVLNKIASEENIEYFILGGYGKAGDNFWINVKIRKALSPEHIGAERAEGRGINSFDLMVDELTPWVKSKLNLTPHEIASDIDRPIGEISTENPEALKYYIDAQMYFTERDFKEGIKQLEKAVELDPEFAIAYKEIAVGYSYLDSPVKAKEYMQKALSLLHRVSERERYLIKGFAANVLDNSPQKALGHYQNLVNLYPRDEEGYLMLAGIYRQIEEWDLAIDQYYKVLNINNRSEIAYSNLSYIYMAKGWYEKSRKILKDSQPLFSNQAIIYKYIAHTFLCQGKFELARREIENAISLESDNYLNTRLIGFTYHIQGDLISARRYYMKLKEERELEVQVEGYLWMSRLYLMQGQYKRCLREINGGTILLQNTDLKAYETDFLFLLVYLNLQLKRFPEALEVIDRILEISREYNLIYEQKSSLHFLGLVYIQMKKLEEAKTSAEHLKQIIEEKGYPKEMRQFYHLMGMISLNNNQVKKSIEQFKKAVSLLPAQVFYIKDQSLYLESLATAFYKEGDLGNAGKEYEKIASLTIGQLQRGDIYAKSFYWLGKIYQEKGWVEKAIEHYQKFLNLLKDADSGISEINGAQEQLNILLKISQ